MARAARQKRTRKQARWPNRRILFLVVGCFLLALSVRAVLGERGLIATWRQRAQVRELEARVERLKRENERLLTEIDQLRRGGYAIEKIAREDLGLGLPHEVVFLLPRPPEDSPPYPGKP